VLRTPAIHRNALIISAIAGTVLNCINQLPDFMDGHGINVAKLVLTYLVPYTVSVVSAIMLSHNQKSQ
jgi:hypothetical protein